MLAFDNGASGEFNTLLVTDWFAHTPPEVLAKNFGVPEDSFKNIPLQQRWIFQGEVPGALSANEQAIVAAAGVPQYPFIYRLSDMKPNRATESGSIWVADSTNFHAATTVAAALVTVKPGALAGNALAPECG